ncbi:MAG: hypothetical protein GQ574_25145 [Crocinitomix sp.]|nr:hypothetical protein [Crocinitomix sp.]
MNIEVSDKVDKKSYDKIVELIIDIIGEIRSRNALRNIPIVCTYCEHNFELEEVNKKLNASEIYRVYQTEVNASMEKSQKIDKVQ